MTVHSKLRSKTEKKLAMIRETQKRLDLVHEALGKRWIFHRHKDWVRN